MFGGGGGCEVDVVIDRRREYGVYLRKQLVQIFVAFMANWNWCLYDLDLKMWMFSRSYPEINRIGRSPETPTGSASLPSLRLPISSTPTIWIATGNRPTLHSYYYSIILETI